MKMRHAITEGDTFAYVVNWNEHHLDTIDEHYHGDPR